MAFIPPIVQPAINMIKALVAQLNETRSMLGLPPVDFDSLMAQAYGEGAFAQTATTQAPAATIASTLATAAAAPPTPRAASTPAPAPAPVTATNPIPSTGIYGVSKPKYMAGADGKKAYFFLPEEITSKAGSFVITIDGDKGSFVFTDDKALIDDLIQKWDNSFERDACDDANFDAIIADSIITVEPGQVQWDGDKWRIVKKAVISDQ